VLYSGYIFDYCQLSLLYVTAQSFPNQFMELIGFSLMAINVLFRPLINGHAFTVHVSRINLRLVGSELTKHSRPVHLHTPPCAILLTPKDN